MPTIQLSDFQQTIDQKYADFEIYLPTGEPAIFRPALRLSKEKRRDLARVLDIETRAAIDNDDDIFDLYRDAFRASEKNPGDFERLSAAIGDDPAVWQELFMSFLQDTQAGEA